MPPVAESHSRSSGPLLQRASFAPRLLAEAVRRWERDTGSAPAEDQAAKTARDAGGDLELRIVNRARNVSQSHPISEAIARVHRASGFVVLTAAILALITGAAAARGALGPERDEPVNFFWVLLSLLGLQTLLLLGWMVILLIRPGSSALAAASLGGFIARFCQWIAEKTSSVAAHQASLHAIAAVQGRGAIGRWTLSTITHLLWTVFNVGCIAMMVLVLSTRHYTFAWQTTILTADSYIPLTRAIAAAPRRAGFLTPDATQIADSHWPGNADEIEAAREAWSGLLIGSLVLYGFAPRFLLLAVCVGRRRAAKNRFRLDLSLPEYLRLQPILMPATHQLGVVDSDDVVKRVQHAAPPDRSPTRPIGKPAIIGFELPEAPPAWPPRLHAVSWDDLGMVDDRDARRAVVGALTDSADEPRAVVIAAALSTTPDRGVGSFLADVRSSVRRPPILLMTAGQVMRDRGQGDLIEDRLSDWRTLAEAAGIESQRILDLDLDHLTAESAARLAAMIDGEDAPSAMTRRIEASFDLMAQRADRWQSAPSTSDQAQLQREIALLYRDDHDSWRRLLDAPREATGDLSRQVRAGADRMIDRLPARLKTSPKWLAAGATAGALGCIAAATLLSPVAIASLPLWSGIGAAVAGIANLYRSHDDEQQVNSEVSAQASRAQAIRAAALFALLLELQGRGESTITRVMDEAIGEEIEDSELAGIGAPRRWLDDVRHRFDLAIVQESAS